ncbi:hypothetical protein QR680_014662 [Steinernema hermaphroditum]|uniref:Uncharacterized protein n=1 Tax=Steinernema hermaphroditum TaxID=289476 RepID=A0AA39IBZ8_9BILA|nr:hypothetical protein QR680_014662 [Steinernema hermaphroditum]
MGDSVVDNEPMAETYYILIYPSLDGVTRYELIGSKGETLEEILQKDRQEVMIGYLIIREPCDSKKSELENMAQLDEALIGDVVRLVAECSLDEGLVYMAIELTHEFDSIQDRFVEEMRRVDLKIRSLAIQSSTALSEIYVTELMQAEVLQHAILDGGFTSALQEPLKEFIFKGDDRKVELAGSFMFDGDYIKDLVATWKDMSSPSRLSRLIFETRVDIKTFFVSWTTPSDHLGGSYDSYLMHDNGRNYVKIGGLENTCRLEFTNIDDEQLSGV